MYGINSKKAIEELNEVQKKTRERNIEIADIEKVLNNFKDYVNIPAKYLDGCILELDLCAQNFPKAYKYTPMSTHAVLVNVSGTWKVKYFKREKCGNRKIMLDLSETALKEVAYSMSCGKYFS